MRAIVFSHFALKAIQQGVQSGHAITEMSISFDTLSPQHQKYLEWAKNCKTVVYLDGGNSKRLKEIAYAIEMVAAEFNLPCARFYEDEDTMEGIMTAVGIIVPSPTPTQFSVKVELETSQAESALTLLTDYKHRKFTLQESIQLLTYGCKLAG